MAQHANAAKSDSIVDAFVRYAGSVNYESLPPAVVHATKIRVIDTFGALVGGFFGDPCRIAREVAAQMGSTNGATIVGTRERTAVDMAAFVNGVTARFVEMNDVYHWPKAGGAHPSDVIMPLIAVAEVERRSGRDLIAAIVLGYEIYLCMANSVRTPGFDFINNQSLAVAIAAGKLMDLTDEQMAQCISLVVVPNNALGQARAGHLSHWKAAASGQAARAGVFAAMLARAGMQGAVTPFEGNAGWSKVVAHGPFTLAPMAGEPGAGHFRILDTIIKPRSSCATTLSSILAAEKAGAAVADARRISGINVEVYQRAVHLGEGEHSFNPDTRETADHSIPYVVAAALMDGTVTPRSFLESRLWDPELRELVQKVHVVHNPDFTADYEKLPVEHRTRVTVSTLDGGQHVGEIRTLKGAPIDPMTDSEIEDKFRMLTGEYLGAKSSRQILDRLWSLEELADAGEIPPAFAF